MLQNLQNAAISIGHSIGESITPVLTTTQFLEKGVLTPEEFVLAGDKLVALCGTWRWEGGDADKRRPYLPAGKQFLTTSRVPCLQRVRALDQASEQISQTEVEDEDGWSQMETGHQRGGGSDDEVGTMEDEEFGTMDDGLEPEPEQTQAPVVATPPVAGLGQLASLDSLAAEPAAPSSDDDDAPDMEDFEDLSLMEDDESTLMAPPPPIASPGAGASDNIQRTRTYDLDISYDKYYQTPRVWLFGYDESSQPLGPEQIFEDISQDHANRTVTFETHPHKNLQYATVHPCRHAVTMKKIMEQLVDGGKAMAVDQYLFLFLKFIASVIPTMEYDFTLPADFS